MHRAESDPARALAASDTTWRPLLHGREQERALDAAEQIAAALVEELDAIATVHPAISSHVALLMHYLGLATGREPALATAERLLERAIDGVAEDDVTAGLHGGLTGVAWVIAHVSGHAGDPREVEGADAVDSLDEALLEALAAHERWPGDFDVVSGLVGIGVYGLERRRLPGGRELVDRVVHHLGRLARWTDRGAAFWRPPGFLGPALRDIYPAGCFDLGLAHGSAGVISWLADLHRASLADDGASHLLDGCVRWVLGQRVDGGQGSVFPSHVGADGRPKLARFAWCYGDPGVSLALYKAAGALRNADWRRGALDVARRAARFSHHEAHVADPGLCHGALGLAHIYNRLWQASGDDELPAAARSWYARALNMGEPLGGLSAYRESSPADHASPADQARPDAGLIDEGSLLGGRAGMGLALLAAATAVEPGWDDLLLLATGP
jgi:lantibiotic biosynthesis protein